MDPEARPSVPFVYFSYTQQTEKVMVAMADVLRDRGCDVTLAPIFFIDPRYEKRFKQFPMPRPYLEVFGMIAAELRHRAAEIGIPDVVTAKRYDFVCIGSPTRWLSTNVPIRSFPESSEASRLLGGTPFAEGLAERMVPSAQPGLPDRPAPRSVQLPSAPSDLMSHQLPRSTHGSGIRQEHPSPLGVAISPIPIIAIILVLLSNRAGVNNAAFAGGWSTPQSSHLEATTCTCSDRFSSLRWRSCWSSRSTASGGRAMTERNRRPGHATGGGRS